MRTMNQTTLQAELAFRISAPYSELKLSDIQFDVCMASVHGCRHEGTAS